jgi:hypothetical protein
MEIRFELATEPAVKAQKALIASISIAYTVTRTNSYNRLLGAIIIGLYQLFSGHPRHLPFANMHAPIK